MPVTLPPALQALVDGAISIARRSPSGRIAIARLDGLVDPALLPAAIREEVAALIADSVEQVEPLAPKDVEKALKAAWGKPPGKLLDELEPEPLAVRAHAQVHRAAFEGQAVALKLQRPGLAASLRSDLVLLDTLARPAAAVFGALDVTAMLREVRARLLDEADLEHEAETQRRAARGLRSLDGVSAAAVHGALTRHTVLVTDLVELPTLSEQAPQDTAAVARALMTAYLGAPRAVGMALANPRPDDVALAPDGGVVLLQVGAGREVERERHDAVIDAIAALRADDEEAFAAALELLGVLAADDARTAHRAIRAILGELARGPAVLDHAAVAAAGGRALDAIAELLPLAGRARAAPADVWPARGAAQLVAVLARLGAREDWLTLAVRAGRAGWG